MWSKTDYAKIGVLSELACLNPEKLFDALGVSLERNGRKYTGVCCIHNGDNNSALNIYTEGDSYVGNWVCRTHRCNAVFKSSLIGFVRGCLSATRLKWSRPGDKQVPFMEAVRFVCDVYKVDWDGLKIDESKIDKRDFLSSTRFLVAQYKSVGMPREKVRARLEMPCEYYLNRGFSREILDRFDVGTCVKSGKILSGRAIVPIYDETNQFAIGFSGRLIGQGQSKWKHHGFKSSETLYNLGGAYSEIKRTQTAIIVESPGNCWRIVESGFENCVALFGVNFSLSQQFLLEKLGTLSIVTILDSDEAGDLARARITEECQRYYNIRHLTPMTNDVGEMSVEDVKKMMDGY